MHGSAFVLGLACAALAACVSAPPAATAPPAPAPDAAASSAAPAPTMAPRPAPGPGTIDGPGSVAGRVVNPWAEPAREVLVQHCGRCHRSDLDTSLKGALAVYDLTKPIWYANLRPDQYDGILERVREAGAIGPEDVATMEAFVACARGGDCPPPP